MSKSKNGRKSVLVFSAYLPCKEYGGPVKSIYNLVEATGDVFDYYIISPDHDFLQETRLPQIQEGWNKVGKATVLYANERDYNFDNILKWINEAHANMIYLSSVFYYRFNFPAIKAAKSVGIPILLAPRSDLLPNCIRIKFVKKAIFLTILKISKRYKDIWYQSTSDDETTSILKWMSVKPNHVLQIPNISSPSLDLPRKEKLEGRLRMVYVGRIHSRKNLKYAIECITKVKGMVSMDVYGTIEDKAYWDECKQIATLVNEGRWLNYCGVLPLEEIQDVYRQYDCLFFPTLNENYGHVIVEAISSGCPVLLSMGTTPWDDYNGNGGFCYPLNNRQEFIDKIEEWVKMNDREFTELVDKTVEYSLKKFDISSLKKQYLSLFGMIMS